jgi:predicted ATPase/transcriptional regulator with XRE-family HTH domain
MPNTLKSLLLEKSKTFGDLLRYARKRVHLTQAELASLVGYHHTYISYLEKNVRLPEKAVLLGRIIPALSLEDEPEIVERLIFLHAELSKKKFLPNTDSLSAGNAPSFSALPPNISPILGRESEIELICELLRRPEIRLLTVVGPPGVGKTKLAIHVAHDLRNFFSDEPVFVDLIPVPHPDFVLGAVSSALGFDRNMSDDLGNAIGTRHVLILLDNMEHVLSAALQLPAILKNSPNIKILVTSREPLRIYGEQEFPLAPLQVVSNDFDSPAFHLFVERARSINPLFNKDGRANQTIMEICQYLDGLPLAIEVVAAQTRLQSPTSILSSIKSSNKWQRQAQYLTTHQKTLEQAISWSFEMLSEPEKILFQKLSVFSGGWTLDAAKEVCNADDSLLRLDFHYLHTKIFERSLIVCNTEQTRHTFLESLRIFAEEQLKLSGQWEVVSLKHAEHFLKFSAMYDPQAAEKKFDEVTCMFRMNEEHNNLRKALEWAITQSGNSHLASELILNMSQFLMLSGNLAEARKWLGRVLDLNGMDARQRSILLRHATDYAGKQGDHVSALYYQRQGMEAAKASGDTRAVYLAMGDMARAEYRQGRFSEAAGLFEEILVYHRTSNEKLLIVRTLNYLAICKREDEYLNEALALGLESIEIARSIDARADLVQALVGVGEVNVRMNIYHQALPYFQEALLLAHQLGFMHGVAVALSFYAYAVHNLGESPMAAQLESASQKIKKEIGVTPATPVSVQKTAKFHSELKNMLGERFEEMWAQGGKLSIEDAIQLVVNL